MSNKCHMSLLLSQWLPMYHSLWFIPLRLFMKRRTWCNLQLKKIEKKGATWNGVCWILFFKEEMRFGRIVWYTMKFEFFKILKLLQVTSNIIQNILVQATRSEFAVESFYPQSHTGFQTTRYRSNFLFLIFLVWRIEQICYFLTI